MPVPSFLDCNFAADPRPGISFLDFMIGSIRKEFMFVNYELSLTDGSCYPERQKLSF